MTRVCCGLLLGSVLFPPLHAAPLEDLVLRTRIDSVGVDVELFLPKESRPVRGLLVHCAHHKIKTTGRWPSLCRELGFAHLNASVSLKANNRPKRLREGMNAALEQFAGETGLPELTKVPRMGTGFSAGGMCIPMLIEEPDQLLTCAVSCSWVTDPEKIGAENAKLPMLYVIGAEPDAFKMLPAIDKHYVPSVTAGNPWALGLQHACKHDWANSGTLFVPWMRGIVQRRLQEDGSLKPIDPSTGWYGDRSTINGQYASVVPAAEYRGEPGNRVWLPDRASAWVWRAWQSEDAPVRVTARTADGAKKLAPFNPRKSFGITVPHAVDLELGVEMNEGVQVERLRFFVEDRLLGEAPPDEPLIWKAPGKRAHVVWVEYTRGGQVGAGNPALIVVE